MLLLSCEHAGNEVPAPYQHLFDYDPEVLHTHRGLDIGALELAKGLADELDAPLFYNCTTRLLIEANRSENTADHFSEYSNSLSDEEKQQLLDTIYRPYRKQVTEAINQLVGFGKSVVHLSVHSFTPNLNGEERSTDIGLLFDPARTTETLFCSLLTEELHRFGHEFTVKDNYPYLGTADGFTTHLRTLFSDEQYAGIELEINQKFPESNENWQHLKSVLAAAVKQALERMGKPVNNLGLQP